MKDLTPEKPQKKVTWSDKTMDNFNEFARVFFNKLKFKKGEHWSKKVLKILIRIFSILVLIALSPLIIITLILIMIVAM